MAFIPGKEKQCIEIEQEVAISPLILYFYIFLDIYGLAVKTLKH